MKIKKTIFYCLAMLFTILLAAPNDSFAATTVTPPGNKITPVILSAHGVNTTQTGAGLFDNTRVSEWDTNKVFYWYNSADFIELQIDNDFRIWRSGTTGWSGSNKKLKTLQWNGTAYVDISASQPTPTAITEASWELTTTDLPAGKYKFSYSAGYRIDSEWYIEQTAPSVPSPPVVTASSSDSQNMLSWSAVADSNGYTIRRSETPGGPYIVIASGLTTTSYTDTAVVNGTTYYYIVTALNASGESGNSSEVSVTPQISAPQAPVSLSGHAVGSQSYLTWSASANAASYHVKRAETTGGPYAQIATVSAATYYTDTNVTKGVTYYYVVSAINAGGESAVSNEAVVTIPNQPILDIVIAPNTVSIGEEFTADVMLRNVSNIYAEDFTISFDSSKFDYLGFEELPGFKVYNNPVDQGGIIRFIVASQGQNYGITGDKIFLKLKLKAKATGIGKVDALKCRIADTVAEADLDSVNCTEDSVTIEGQPDVNRSGEYTLLDLAIDSYYFGKLASNADPMIYNANQAGDEYVTNEDLVFIVNQMLANTNYSPNY